MAPQNAEVRPLRIIIVGGGIAGLASAIALRASNRQIIILEQSRLNREIGATISLQPNASKILEKGFGMKEMLTKAGALRDEGFNIYTTEGKLQAKIPLTSKIEYGADRMIYHRMDLHEALKHHATSSAGHGDPVEIRTSSCVASCDTASGTVTLSDGSVLQGDIVVAADGIKSNLRKCVLGQEVHAQPTGLAAYRLMVRTSDLEKDEDFCRVIDPRKPYTSMVMGHDRRMIMGPARGGDVYSLVALVPDKQPVDSGNSWTSKGDYKTLMKEYEEFPDWVKAPFRLAGEDIGLWQLRDTEPLTKWHSGRVILIGDACHAMLPTQGQGASQAIEDAEALGAYLSDVDSTFTVDQVESRLQEIFDARYERATTVQKYSREAARPATDKGDATIKMNPAEFMDYNCLYDGAKDWVSRNGRGMAVKVV